MWVAASGGMGVEGLVAQRGGMFLGSLDDPAIKYSTAPIDNVVVDLNKKLADGTVRLSFEGRSGYLQSALDALGLPVESQMLVFSPTSFQARRINAGNPRALFYNDSVELGWVRDGDVIEVAAQDAHEGVVFYTLDQRPVDAPRFQRVTTCLGCHLTRDTLGVPGLLMFSTTRRPTTGRSPAPRRRIIAARSRNGGAAGSSPAAPDLRSTWATRSPPVESRASRELATVNGLFDMDGYRKPTSDIAALMVLSHQTHMTNLITRAGWEARASDPTLHAPFVAAPGEDARIAAQMRDIASEVVDYLLFIDETPLAGPIRGSSGFTERFSSAGVKRRAGAVAAPVGLDQAPDAVSVQLPDLLCGVRWAAVDCEERDLRQDVAGAVWRREGCALPNGAVAGRSSGDCRHPSPDQERPARLLPPGQPLAEVLRESRGLKKR